MEDDAVESAVRRIARRHGCRTARPVAIRSGANHVYAADELLIRVARANIDVDQHLTIGRLLHESGVPVPRPIASGEVGEHHYSVWEYIESDGPTIDYRTFGEGIRALHAIDLNGVDLPWCDEADWLDITRNLDLARAGRVVSLEDIDLLEAHAPWRSSWPRFGSWRRP